MVQPELHPEDEGRQVDGNSGQPHADAAAAGVPEAVDATAADAAEATPRSVRHPTRLSTRRPSDAARSGMAGDDRFSVAIRLPIGRTPPPIGPNATAPRLPARRSDEQRHPAGAGAGRAGRLGQDALSAAVYAILIVTFGFQVARVEGQSMAPTLEDQDRLIVNKLVYRIGEPRRGDIVMLYYPLNPDKSFVKRVIAEEGDTVRIVDGRVYVNDIPLHDDYVPAEYRSHDDWGPQVIPEGLLLRHGRPPEQQLRQPALGHGAEEVHHRQGAAAVVAGADGAGLLAGSGLGIGTSGSVSDARLA